MCNIFGCSNNRAGIKRVLNHVKTKSESGYNAVECKFHKFDRGRKGFVVGRKGKKGAGAAFGILADNFFAVGNVKITLLEDYGTD